MATKPPRDNELEAILEKVRQVLVSDAPVSRIDLILCRNVFIYLDSELQKRVLSRLHFALRRDGVLVLGRSEFTPFAARLFEPVDLTRRIYRKDARQEIPLLPHDRLGAPWRCRTRSAWRSPLPSRTTSGPSEEITTLANQAAARLWSRLPHGGRGRATLVATPLIIEAQTLGKECLKQ